MSASDFSMAAFVDVDSITAASADALLVSDDDFDSSPASTSTPASTTTANTTGLLKVPYAFELSREVYSKIKQNLIWAVGYNFLAVLISVGALSGWGVILTP
jgi:cation transport ATPase